MFLYYEYIDPWDWIAVEKLMDFCLWIKAGF